MRFSNIFLQTLKLWMVISLTRIFAIDDENVIERQDLHLSSSQHHFIIEQLLAESFVENIESLAKMSEFANSKLSIFLFYKYDSRTAMNSIGDVSIISDTKFILFRKVLTEYFFNINRGTSWHKILQVGVHLCERSENIEDTAWVRNAKIHDTNFNGGHYLCKYVTENNPIFFGQQAITGKKKFFTLESEKILINKVLDFLTTRESQVHISSFWDKQFSPAPILFLKFSEICFDNFDKKILKVKTRYFIKIYYYGDDNRYEIAKLLLDLSSYRGFTICVKNTYQKQVEFNFKKQEQPHLNSCIISQSCVDNNVNDIDIKDMSKYGQSLIEFAKAVDKEVENGMHLDIDDYPWFKDRQDVRENHESCRKFLIRLENNKNKFKNLKKNFIKDLDFKNMKSLVIPRINKIQPIVNLKTHFSNKAQDNRMEDPPYAPDLPTCNLRKSDLKGQILEILKTDSRGDLAEEIYNIAVEHFNSDFW